MNFSHSCPLCKASKKFQKFRTNKIFGKIGNKKRAFYQCLNCDIFYLFPRLNKKEEKKFYEKDFEKFMGDRSKRKNDWRDIEKHIISNKENKLRRFKYLKNLIKGKKNILEYGCSSGFMLFPLIQKNYNCYGIEPSGKFYDYLISKNLKIYKNENEFIKKNKNQKLDVIMHFFVMEHIFNLKEFINKQMNLLNKKGVIVAEIPNADDPLNTIYKPKAFENFYWSIAHPWYFNQNSLKYFLDSLGYKYKIIKDQRYDLSNHMYWQIYGKPGGQSKFSEIFGKQLDKEYINRLIQTGYCDTLIAIIYKN